MCISYSVRELKFCRALIALGDIATDLLADIDKPTPSSWLMSSDRGLGEGTDNMSSK